MLSRLLAILLAPFRCAFTKPMWQKILALIGGTLLASGRRTVAITLQAVGLQQIKQYTSKNVTSSIQNASNLPDLLSLDLALDLAKEYMKIQQQQVLALDNKASVVLGAATALVSSILILQAIVIPSHCSLPNERWQIIPISFLLLVYLWVVLAALMAYSVRGIKVFPSLEQLHKNYITSPEVETKKAVFRSFVKDEGLNKEILNKKVKWLNIAMIALACEAAVLVGVVLTLFLLFQTTC